MAADGCSISRNVTEVLECDIIDICSEASFTSSQSPHSPTTPFSDGATQISVELLPDLENYIPAGCIRVHRSDTAIEVEEWQTCSTWTILNISHGATHSSGSTFDAIVQEKLFRSSSLVLLRGLYQASWIKLEFMVHQKYKQWGIVRVHILPDDTHRRLVDRSDRSLRKALHALLQRLDISQTTWHGDWSDNDPGRFLYTSETIETSQTLFQLFNTIPSPSPDASLLHDMYDAEAMQNILDGAIPGLKTEMFPYQRRSAAMMLQMESLARMVIDPRLSKQIDCHGGTWYCNITDGTVLREPRMYEGPRGGVNAETMGLGKTLICLSLILATRDMSPKIPDEYSIGTIPVREKTGSLLEMCGSAIGRSSIPWRRYFREAQQDGREFTNCAEAIKNGAGCYFIPPPESRRQSRNPTFIPPRKIYLCNTTLIVVPRNLVRQWEHEIAKHTLDSTLKVLVMKELKQKLPPAKELVTFDIILFSRQRFDAEAKHGTNSSGYRPVSNLHQRKCRNLDCDGTSSCDCFLANETYQSPLTEIHCKRLITDEGHVMGNSSDASGSNAVIVVDFLCLSARWIISGTPTPGLYGEEVMPITDVSFGRASSSLLPMPISNNAADRSTVQALDLEQERKDLEKLGNIAKVYLKSRPWAATHTGDNDVAQWSTYVMQPRHGTTSHGNQACLKRTLEGMMVRHRQEDIEVDIKLPPLHQRMVFLEPSFQDKLNINMFALVIISNAITSERKDADYLFHPSQRKALGNLVSNLRTASFFWSGFTKEDIQTTVHLITEFIRKEEVVISDEDQKLLLAAARVGNATLDNPVWLAASENHEIPFHVRNNLPARIRCAWSLDGEDNNPTLFGATQLRVFQQLAIKQRAVAMHDLNVLAMDMLNNIEERGIATMVASKAALDPSIPRKPSKFARTQKKLDDIATAFGEVARIGSTASDRTGSMVDLPSISGEAKRSTSDLLIVPSSKRQKLGDVLDYTQGSEEVDKASDLISLLDSAQIISTASSKLSYLVDQISFYAPLEKIIVFYETDNIAYYIAQALDAICINHLIYAKTLTAERRSRYLLTYNQSPKFRVLLMDISQAAFGLDISVASRVYFINPVLDRQVEAQAVKRAHRIGQARPVYVETLVLKHTIEEVIVERRQQMSTEEQKKLKTVLDDNKLYEWIRDVRLVPLDDTGSSLQDQLAQLESPHSAFPLDIITHDRDEGLMADITPDKKGKGRDDTRPGDLDLSVKLGTSSVSSSSQSQSRSRRKKGQPVYTTSTGARYWIDGNNAKRSILADTKIAAADLMPVEELPAEQVESPTSGSSRHATS